MRKPHIEVVVVERDGQYDVGNGKIERIGDRQSNRVSWKVHNDTAAPIHVQIHNFAKNNFAPGPNPVDEEDFTDGKYDSHAKGDNPIGKGKRRIVKGRLTGDPDLYTYEFYVSSAQTGAGNAVDPELQIDGRPLFAPAPLVATLGLVAGFALAYWWFIRESPRR